MIKEQVLDMSDSLGLMSIWCYYSTIPLIQKLVLWITCYSPGHLWHKENGKEHSTKLLHYVRPLQHQISVHYHLLCQHIVRTHSTTNSWK